MRFILTSDEKFKDFFEGLKKRSDMDMSAVTPAVSQILQDVKNRGDVALFEQIA